MRLHLMLACALATAAHAQRPPGSQVKPTVPVPSPVASYTVEVTAFTMTPAQPRQGDQVTFQLTLRNTGSTPASVPWLIALQGGAQMVGQGTVGTLSAGSTQTLTATWRALGGTHDALGTVSPPGVGTSLNAAPASARARSLAFTVAQSSASTTPSGALVAQLIDWNRVRVAGGTFADGLQGACISRLGPASSGPQLGEVVASLDCVTPAAQGGRMNPVFFDQFALRNGWRVKSFNVVKLTQTCPNASGWQVPVSPARGSVTPRVQLAMWGNAGCYLVVAARLEIEGPSGTDPYQ